MNLVHSHTNGTVRNDTQIPGLKQCGYHFLVPNISVISAIRQESVPVDALSLAETVLTWRRRAYSGSRPLLDLT